MQLPDFLAFSSDSNRRGGPPPLSDRSKGETGSCCKSMHLFIVFVFLVGRSYRCRAARRRTLVLVRSSSGLVVPSSSPLSCSVVSYSAIACRRLAYC